MKENRFCKYALHLDDIMSFWILNFSKQYLHVEFNKKFICFDRRPAFLPDPKDGSIYMIGASLKDPLKKLPFTIPELVAASPCKSTDGTLYTGKKVDTWFSIDRFTGTKKVCRHLNFRRIQHQIMF